MGKEKELLGEIKTVVLLTTGENAALDRKKLPSILVYASNPRHTQKVLKNLHVPALVCKTDLEYEYGL